MNDRSVGCVPPRIADIPTTPSFPMVTASMASPLLMQVTVEATTVSGKQKNDTGSPGSQIGKLVGTLRTSAQASRSARIGGSSRESTRLSVIRRGGTLEA